MKRIVNAVWVVVLVSAVVVWARTTVQPTSGSVEQELLKLEQDWANALVKADLTFLEGIFTEDWTATDQDGAFYSRAQYLAYLKSGEEVSSSLVFDDMKVRIYGDAAVVTGRSTFKGMLKGKDVSGQDRYTDTFAKRAGRWQCVASHWSRIVQK